jgi:hypothetical protein
VDGVVAADGVAVCERAGCGVSVGDTELVRVGVGVVDGGDVDPVGSGEVEDCPVVDRLPAGGVCGGLTSQ